MSESHATTSVFLSCAVARLPAASAAAPTPAVTRKSRRLTRAPMCVPPSVRDLFGPEKDVLRALQVRAVELPHQLLPRGRRDVLLVLLRVADLDPLDVVPARGLGPVDRALDTVGAIAHDAGQRPRHLVVVVHEPALVVLGLHARLERGDHIAYRHGRASRATGQGFEAVEHVARFQHVVALRDGLVARHEPRLVLGGLRAELRQDLADRRPVAKLEGRPRRSLGKEASKRAVHHHRDRHWPAARTRGITSAWNRSIVCSMRPSGATGYIISWVAPSRARRT